MRGKSEITHFAMENVSDRHDKSKELFSKRWTGYH